jgi:hypothetical protein
VRTLAGLAIQAMAPAQSAGVTAFTRNLTAAYELIARAGLSHDRPPFDIHSAMVEPSRYSGLSVGPANGSQLATVAAAAEEHVAAVRLETRHGDAGRHIELLQNLACF